VSIDQEPPAPATCAQREAAPRLAASAPCPRLARAHVCPRVPRARLHNQSARRERHAQSPVVAVAAVARARAHALPPMAEQPAAQQRPPSATGAELLGMAKYLGVRCNSEHVAYLGCKERYNHPEDCLEEAKAVLKCSQHL